MNFSTRSFKFSLAFLFVALVPGISSAVTVLTTGLQLYLDADNLALSNGDPVSTWANTGLAGATGNATQATANRQPEFVTNAVNGHAVVRFDGGLGTGGFAAADYMSVGNLPTGSAYTAFFVFKVDNDPPAGTQQTGFVRFNAYDQDTHLPYTDGNVYDATLSTVRKTTGNPAFSLTQYRIYSVESQTGLWRSRFGGVDFFTTGTNTPAINNGTGNMIGASTLNGQHLDGDFAAILIYNFALNGDQYTQTFNALNSEYLNGVPEPASGTLLLFGLFGLRLVRRKK